MSAGELRHGQWADKEGYLHDFRFPTEKWVYCPDDQGWCKRAECMAAVACRNVDPA